MDTAGYRLLFVYLVSSLAPCLILSNSQTFGSTRPAFLWTQGELSKESDLRTYSVQNHLLKDTSNDIFTHVHSQTDYGTLLEEWLANKRNITKGELHYLWLSLLEQGNVEPNNTYNMSEAIKSFIKTHGVTDGLLDTLLSRYSSSQWSSSVVGNTSEAQRDGQSAPQYRRYGRRRSQRPAKRRKHKIEQLGKVLRKRVAALRSMPGQKLELVFLVDSSSTIGRRNFANELQFVSKLLIDFTVDALRTRVALVTFSSQDRVVRHVDHLSDSTHLHNKCSLLERELTRIHYTGGATDTLGAFKEAQRILSSSREGAHRAVFLVTDGFSNFGDPRPLAASLRASGVEVFSFGIMQGNTEELNDLASDPKDEHAYLLDTFDEFEALARRALHTDLPPGDYIRQPLGMCDSLCPQGKSCCDKHATCTCGTHTGKYECICNPGFYGSGIRNSCHVCPSGTYKPQSEPGDVNTCSKCPDVHHVSQSGSTTIDACMCKAGYRQVANNQCAGDDQPHLSTRHRRSTSQFTPNTTMECPLLEPPEHGYFVQKCRNVFNAGCGIRCETGYKLTGGKSLRVCKNGTWTGTQPRCVVRRCPPLKAPNNGSIKCRPVHDQYTFGTTCRFECNTGYQRVGSEERSCLSIGFWNGITPKCREVQCPPLPELVDGTVFIPECTQQRMPVNMTCTMRCKSGFRMAGHERKMCMPDGSWAPHEAADNKCVDVQAPVILCPESRAVPTDAGRNTAHVAWTVPTAVDNSGFRPTVTVTPVMRPDASGIVSDEFPIGSLTLTYTAVDRKNNQASCSFTIVIRDLEPPRMDNCTSPRPFIADGRPVHVTWDEPVFTDNSLQPPTVRRDRQPGVFPPGVTTVTYTATDDAGNNSTCTIRVNVQDNACAQPEDPQHGQAHCSESRSGVVCQLQCNTGYGFALPPPERYFCDLNTGYWLPANRWPFPDCSASRLSNHVTQFNNVVLHASTTCADRVYVTQVQQDFINSASNRVSGYCAPHITCEIHDVYTECKPRMHVDPDDFYTNTIDQAPPDIKNLDNSLGALPLGQQGVRTARVREESTITINFQIEGIMAIDHNAVGSAHQIQGDLTEKLKEVVIQLEDDALIDGAFDIEAKDQPITVKTMAFNGSPPKFKCKPGSVLQATNCINCPVGTFYNVVSEQCDSCSVGTYQPNEGSVTCLVCPSNTSTAANNSKSVSQCKGQCLPGSSSDDGLERCETCPIGYYQPQYGQISCIHCPRGNTTRGRGARTITECAARCPAGHVSHSGLALTKDPCLACPRGYFQPHKGNTRCLLCPGAVRTPEKGSTSVTHCEGITEENVEDYRSIPIQELVVNECFAEPCENGATCESLAVSYVCHCAPGWAGLTCESEINECLSDPCQNNATCQNFVSEYKCVCQEGFTGSQCEIDIDDCASFPCVNDGTCRDGHNQYTCHCLKGYDGKNCDNNIDDCLSDPCQNGGVCMDQVAAYECVCPLGFNGHRCHQDIDECSSSPCQNEATCVDDINSFGCECVAGYAGTLCEQEVDECDSLPCANGGSCVDNLNNFYCECPPSYTGLTCETQLNSSFIMTWNATSIRSYMRLECCRRNLTEVSVAFWIRTDDTSNFGTPVSYATATNDNELSVTDYNGFTIYVHGQNKVTDVEASDGRWHHIAVTWSSSHGHWEIYKDGELQDSGDGLAKGEVIEGGGVYVAGQDQDGFGEHFNTREAFVGSLTRLNIWPEALHAQRILQLTTSCDEYGGKGVLVAWPDFLGEVHGDAIKTDSTFCDGCQPPHPISHGNVTYNGTIVESSLAIYTCDLGFDLIGQQYRKCLISSEWDGESPMCKKKKCPFPEDIPHGFVSGAWVRYGDTIRYHCSHGYRLVGNATRFCNADGIWEGPIPACQEITCDPPVIEHPLSLRDIDNRRYYHPDDRLRPRCSSGFHLERRGTLVCGEYGTWEGILPTCRRLECGPPPIISNSIILSLLPSYPAGSEVEYACMDGYSLEGPDTVHCQDQGTWEAFRPQCRQVSCVPPPDIPNGGFTPDELDERILRDSDNELIYTVRAKVRYMCSRGFRIVGDHTLICNADGLWNTSVPSCEKVECPAPEPPNNGSVIAISHRFRDIASYFCDPGFTPKGALKSFCSQDGTWSNSAPICKPISCSEPETISNGQIIGSSYTFGESVTYDCVKGFDLEGFRERTCSYEGEWINPVPVCKPVECPKPPDISHGRVLHSELTFRSEAEYTCDAQYRLVGNATRTCLDTGEWSGESPYCNKIKCMEPTGIPNGAVNSANSEYDTGTVVKYKCSVGYKLEDKSTRTCRADGTWSGPVPICKPIYCKTPNDIVHGAVDYKEMHYGATAQYSCTDGFQLDGPSSRMCSDNSVWSGDEPSCEAITCPKPEAISHGQLDAQSLSMGAVITYKCHLGFRLVGFPTRTCLQNQTWSLQAPWCQAIECQQPSKVISNGRMISSNFTFGSTIHYVCDSGYEADGETTRTCQSDGRWNATIPICERVTCPKLEAVDNAIIEGYDLRFNEVLTYICDNGYELVGNNKRRCLSDKRWSGKEPKCVRITCPQPQPIEHGHFRLEGVVYKNKVMYECDHGYELSGDNIRTCEGDKTWSGSTPVCRQVKCDAPPSIPNGIVMNDENSIHFGDVIQYRCDHGYVLSNASMLTCSARGGYTGQIPLCVAIKCSPPEQVTNADIVGTLEGNSRRRGYGDMIEYVCRAGYDLIGSRYRRCKIDGKWSREPPTCEPVTCPMPNAIVGGTANTSQTLTFGERIVYSCEEGRMLQGNRVRTCNAERKWTGTDPVCVMQQCDFPEIDNGYVDFAPGIVNDSPAYREAYANHFYNDDIPKYDYGEEVDFSCDDGYVMQGDEHVQCTGHNVWKPKLPKCILRKCDPLIIENGVLSPSGILEYGVEASVTCLEGYRIDGSSKLFCSAGGLWSEIPACILVRCSRPYFYHGNMSVVRSPNRGSGYPYGMTIKFTCHSGYEMKGVNAITCQDNGQWSEEVPECHQIICNRPSMPPESHAVVLSYGLRFRSGMNISIGCTPGYESESTSVMHCDLVGKWTGGPPVCTIAYCSADTFQNGKTLSRGGLSLPKTQIGDVATFHCNEGFTLVGRRELACFTNKTWSGSIPKCERRICQDIEIDSGRVIASFKGSSHFVFGTKATFTCTDGHELSGNTELTCGPDGHWSGSIPTCTKIICQTIAIENGRLDPVSEDKTYQYNDKVSVICEEGHQLSESQTSLTCRSDATWSSKAPKCVISLCPTPVLAHGQVGTVHPDSRQVKGYNVFGQTVSFECDKGYKRLGLDFAVCTSNGTWSREPPTCQLILCPQLAIQNGRVANFLFASLVLGSKIKIQCLRGYELRGSRHLECVGDGEWQGIKPECMPRKCPTPQISHGMITGSTRATNNSGTYTYGDNIRIVCDQGYELIGTAEMVCRADKTWSVDFPPRCDEIMCPPIPKIKNSALSILSKKKSDNNITGYQKYGTSVLVDCMPGYQLDQGDSRLTCGSNKAWMGRLPECNPRSCSPINVDNGHVIAKSSSSNTFMFGNTIQIICNEGYQISNQDYDVTCLDNGTWSATPPSCIKRRCSDISVQNGRVLGDSFNYEDTVEFVCNEGYKLLGPESCRCQANGEWNCMPLCYRISCPRPQIIAHGSYVATGYYYGERLRYQCETGFDMLGEADQVCQADTTWSGDTPSCHRSSCSAPSAPTNGRVIGNAYSYGERIQYVCRQGFRLVGNQYAECMVDKSWGPTPECIRITCPEPADIKHGQAMKTHLRVGSVVRYVCDEGYSSRGNVELHCEETGDWRGTPPVCHPVTCPPPIRSPNGFVLGSQRHYKAEVEHHCTTGFKMRGAIKQVCTANGTWSGSPPRCEVITCTGPAPLANGHIDITAFFFGSVITYDCNYGYRLEGPASRTCQENGSWTATGPKCVAITCPVPPRIANGDYMGKDTKVDSLVFYTCLLGYRLVGNHQRVCQYNGTWSGSDPTCALKQCTRPSPLVNGSISGDSFIAGSLITFHCDPGFTLSGQATITCRNGDKWSHDFPTCSRISCGLPRDIDHGSYRGISFRFRDVITYECKTGFAMQGNAQVICQSTGLWSPVEAHCVVGDCGRPPFVRFATASPPFRCDTGKCVSYMCQTGYELNGPYVVHCGADGDWMSPFPVCEAKSCGIPPVIHHSSTTVTELSSGGLIVQYSCNIGYTLRGDPNVLCMANGTWTFNRKPFCEPLSCGEPPRVPNSLVLGSEHTVGHFARYRCDTGFKLVGHAVIRCHVDGTWNDTGPVCVGRTCPHPELVDNAYINSTDFSLGANIEYVCSKGYLPIGETNRTCREGRWTGSPPVCRVVQCRQLQPPNNGHLSTQLRNYNTVVTVSCNPGYQLTGNETILCLETGEWDSPLPRCSYVSGSKCLPPTVPKNVVVPQGPFHAADVITLTCAEGFLPIGNMDIICSSDESWTRFDGECKVAYCGPPHWPDPNLIVRLRGRSYSFGSRMVYMCRNGLTPATHTVLTCTAQGVWDNTPRCVASCKFECQNGGSCVGTNKCKCQSGYTGRFCEQAVCILQCLNGGRCTAPYHCECPYGYTGPRCQKAVCNRTCANGGRCIRPNRCQCPPGFKPPFCEESNRSYSIDSQGGQNNG